MLLEGLHIPVTTPFHPDGRLNTHKLASNITRYSKTPAAGLILLAPSAEPTLLSDDETRDLLRAAAQSAAPEKVLIAGISRDSAHSTLTLAPSAAELHYDAILIGIPSIPTTAPELLTFFQTIADRSPLPLILLNTATHSLPLHTTAMLAAHPNILGLLTTQPAVAHILHRTSTIRREVTVTTTFAAVTHRMKLAAAGNQPASTLLSAASLTATATAVAEPPPIAPPLRTRTKSVGFQIIAASTPTLLTSLNAGATAIAPAFAACAPQAAYEVFAAWKDSDQPLAEEKQLRLIAAAHLAEASPAALKHACDLNGYFGGPPRLPHLPLTGEQRTAIEQAMKPLRN
jgi:4-hydroxy-2-oxoglutarate aldolase